MKEIVFAGAGGQGVLTSGLLISQIAVFKGYHATWIPQYGSAMRGGTANCTVKFGEEYIYNPSQEEPDILLAMNTPSFNKFLPLVKPGGTIIVNSDMVDTKENKRDDITIIEVPCVKLAKDANHPKGANIIMAAVIVKVSKDFTEEEALNGMNDMFRKKGKEKFEAMNTKAFKIGYNFI
ncbi:2-oxoglutarate ferredoxin oxidoreductase subunit gamma [Clostridium acetireducens DSM 10703]|jgi:2-oxoglutarate ferredoxin oxidoreductase subunit gamma|uniref:2-oxoglutarate ferredoxin oxidoreductase subunit gamma n=1 Tax=Clostridium acetireducens DSM 10703 TaxID=1121290 RepID=A0A1E8EXJ8_9CLOT|nr:2-oxoacid:acceptor oxidoreductase family protein [Clostridium acetireducens]OFI05497.1 2-oxoglutarate ferredoxin oxidoreductase subunit gamma [Clostridium acetireducens DSM 10703]